MTRMVIIIGADFGPLYQKHYSTPFGEFTHGEVVEAPHEVAEWLIHSRLASVARNWRIAPEKTAPKPIATRQL